VRFFGFSSVIPFSVIQFVSVAFQSDGFGLDNVIYASADADTIPQPGGLALVLLALALLRLVRQRGLD
jgi:MYXO-CTERM domain-containing protein